MKFLYAPWRTGYLTKAQDRSRQKGQSHCPFCQKIAENQDEKNLILTRRKHAFVVLNLYPYNTAHTMVIPYRHCADLTDLTDEERTEIMALLNETITKTQSIYNPNGFNIGMNLGAAAGAGIPEHLHMHVLPRWQGDTNFLPLLGQTKQISYDLLEVYRKLKEVF